MSVAALVVNFNGGERVGRTVAALYAQSATLTEVMLVDNGSSDGSPERLQQTHPQLRIVRLEDNPGVSFARNRGLELLTAEFVVVVDHDVYVAADCIARLLDCAKRTGAAVVCPRIRLVPEEWLVQADGAELHFLGALRMRHAFERRSTLPTTASEVGGAIAACQLMHRETVLREGAFDELIFFYFEDLEFSTRLRSRGLAFWCEPLAEVFHERGDGTPGLSYRGRGRYPQRRAYLTLRHRLLILIVHYELRTLLLLSPVLLIAELASLASATLKGWPLQWLRAYGWVVANRREILQRRRTALRCRRIGDSKLLSGGAPPLAQGYADGQVAGVAVRIFSATTGLWWRLVSRWLS